MSPRVFLVTGTSSGFGAELVKKILKSGDIAIAASRNSSKLSFEGTTPQNYLGVDLDVTSQESVDSAFKKAVSQFKTIDVVVNNAGYGLNGEFESLSEPQIRRQLEVNLFGLMKVTKKALEHMRESKKGGVIQQVTSIGGQIGVPLYSSYCASKWGVEGFTEALSKELKPEWNIKLSE
jgi:NAD(P)-dependent dehydrogenase (short-subunit alcohol dehydrogenase family)